jgi:hypothetical protein
MMGEQKIIEPNKDGVIKVNVTNEPIYITYSIPPSDYYAHSYEEAVPEEPTVDPGDYVVLTPFFEGYTFDIDTKDYGHELKDGMKITVSVTNHSEFLITGQINVEIPGFEVDGLDQFIAVMPHAERKVTLTIHKVGDIVIDDHILFTGNFTIDGEEYECSPTAVNVYYGEKCDRQITSVYSTDIKMDKAMNPDILKAVEIHTTNFKGTADNIIIDINGEKFTNFTYKVANEEKVEGILSMDLSSLKPGKYRISVGYVTPGGDMQVTYVNLRYDGEKVFFSTAY